MTFFLTISGSLRARSSNTAALITTSQRAEYAPEQLKLVLTTMSARIVEPACVMLPLLGKILTASEIAADRVLSRQLRAVVDGLLLEGGRTVAG
jgi:chromate reductase